jgi:hypothetical protein
MDDSLAFLVGLLERDDAPDVAWEELQGPHRTALKRWQEMGFFGPGPGINPVPTCPHCEDGVPYALDERFLCHHCRSDVDPQHLLLWRLDRGAFLRWLAGQLQLQGEVRQIDQRLWQLGTGTAEDEPVECFFRQQGPLSEIGRTRLSAFRNVLLLFGLALPPDAERRLRSVSLLELLRMGPPLAVRDVSQLLRTRGIVRFDADSGALWVGDRVLGDVPLSSKEFFFLDCLARDLDRFVSYADIKRFVLRQSGSRDATEEATFCQRLKNRIKKKWLPQIDQLLLTTNKGDGYRLRASAEL